MNELGLTREYIRDICDDIVHKYVQKALTQDRIDAVINKAVEYEIRKMNYERRIGTDTFIDMVKREATKQLEVFVRDNITIGKK